MTEQLTSTVLVDGLAFAEGPRWHDGALWLSDMHADEVLRISPEGETESIVTVPQNPSGLGWLPNGDLLIVSMLDRQLLRLGDSGLETHADLSQLASWYCNDMVVDTKGNAYVGNFGFDLHKQADPKPAELILVEANGNARVVANDMMFPNGTVITADGATLIVAESFAGRLTAFDVADNGDLANRRIWAQLPKGVTPDGICLDEGKGIWVASPTSDECVRVEEGGTVTHRVGHDRGAFACMLGGSSGDTLYCLTSKSSAPDACRAERTAQVETCTAPYARSGCP